MNKTKLDTLKYWATVFNNPDLCRLYLRIKATLEQDPFSTVKLNCVSCEYEEGVISYYSKRTKEVKPIHPAKKFTLYFSYVTDKITGFILTCEGGNNFIPEIQVGNIKMSIPEYLLLLKNNKEHQQAVDFLKQITGNLLPDLKSTNSEIRKSPEIDREPIERIQEGDIHYV